MATRPCQPSADTKGLWQLLLPQTPFPACGAGEDAAADAKKSNRDDCRPRAGGGPVSTETQ
jgi:hypothetical protein